ncbi:amino acid adenylation domain-containing protein [Mycobacterium paraterrae]|uniref:Amino acid adenylation domain-containing protein n=1 Tax=Mycobacterium paraterrae TaxID=577492 RepID=A0ABY3VPI0_9MYCO|nr:amino acid adenylation domain-containing protein [Mycobacterium paraterrae]UMB71351.1 amino acid adenylation domain-containing protein [Mycobacterium paraterrae]
MTAADVDADAAVTPDIEDVMALSPLQEGLYSLTILSELADSSEGQPADDPYVIGMAADIFGPLDVALLRDCAAKMLVRHPNLRASFFSRGIPRPVQIVPSRVELPWRDVTAAEGDIDTIELDERRRPFDLERLPAIRFLLIELPDARWRLVITAHHIVIDGWSLPVFVAEMMILYRAGGDLAALPVAPRPYRDYIGWLAGRDQQASQRVWREHLAGLPGPTLLAAAFGGEDAARTSTRLPQRTELQLDAEATARLVAGARSRGVTLNTLLQTAWATILSRLTDRDDVVFGVTVSGRPAELAGVETMVGLFINTVPLRVRLDAGMTVGELCRAVQRDSAILRDHSYLGHAQLRAMGGVGEMYDTLLVYENFPTGAVAAGDQLAGTGVTFRPAAVESLTHFPIVLAAHMADDRLVLMVEVIDGAIGNTAADTLGRRLLTTAERLLGQWDRPLREVSVLSADEAGPLGSPVAKTVEARSIHARFAEVAARVPDSPAVTWAGGAMTYRELDAAANRMAGALLTRGVGAETPVAIRLPRGPQYIVAMFAALKAGATYVPLEPGMPVERVNSILRQSGAAIVVDEDFAIDGDGDFQPADVDPCRAAYVVFTSGTTGEPKGVIGTHAAISAYADDHLDHVLRPAAARLGRPLRIAHAWSFAFDAAWQPLVALLDGHAVHVVDEHTQTDAEALVAAIAEHGVDMIDTTPSMFAQLRSAGLLTRVPLAVLALGGEALGGSSWSFIRSQCTRTGMTAFNCYGPTETTVEAVVAAIHQHDEPSIGYPTGHTRGYVLDSALRPVAAGVAGELYLGGAQLARGYLHQAGETAQRFLADPFVPGSRMYRTGDVVRRQPDGSLRYVGRADAQVKIRGHRVEPGEVAMVLESHPSVRHASVVVHERHGAPRLTAYVAVRDSATVSQLRRMLATRLPRYMVPQRIVTVDEIPLTANGKLDETALAALDSAAESAGLEPETATESALIEVLTEILNVARVDVGADFLELGLDSIVALSVVQAARRRGIGLRARLILECGSVRELAAAIDAEAAEPNAPTGSGDTESGPIPLLANARWLYEFGEPRRLAQAEAIRLPDGVTGEHLRAALRAIAAGHEVLRTRLDRATMTLHPQQPGDFLTEVEVSGDLQRAVATETARAIDSLDPERGQLLAAAWLRPSTGQSVLVLAAHVLALDPVSWQVVLGELDATLHALMAGNTAAPVREHTSYRRWVDAMTARAGLLDSEPYWTMQLAGDDPEIGRRRLAPHTDRAGGLLVQTAMLDADSTARLLKSGLPVFDLLIAAASRMITRWRQQRGQPTPPPLLALETHGRADALVDNAADTTDTVGLLSAIYPLRVDTEDPRRVRELLSSIPGDGVDFGLLRYLRDDTAARLSTFDGPQVLLNYLGRAEVGGTSGLWLDRGLLNGVSPLPEPDLAVRYELSLVATVLGSGEYQALVTQWRALPDILTESDIAALQQLWTQALEEMVP